ncbi:hypothetical protein INT45_014074 [Circinella minor]|uniref:Uncharacterized protein n=1 Tax=Circinella minor TaxID=1195481 RepID=A0A8H7VN17_9FUNG|nr:hypothetical protein INT45_014074 [Circinella minor]
MKKHKEQQQQQDKFKSGESVGHPLRQFGGSSYAALGNVLKPIFNTYKDNGPNKKKLDGHVQKFISLQSRYNLELDELFRGDVDTNGNFKIDIRALNRVMVQRYTEEEDLTVVEVARSDPGSFKYQSDRCKLFSESKVIIGNFLLDNPDVDNIYS